MSKAHVIGFGKSGVAAARLLKKEGWEVVLSDSANADILASRNTSENFLHQQQELTTLGITVKLGYSLDLNDADLPQLIVVSPGVPWDIPLLVKARELGIETIGEMELAWRHLQTIPWVGITGTNGKTTTTALTAAIFQAAGFNAPACGNIGLAACEVALSQDGGVGEWGVGGQGGQGRQGGQGGQGELATPNSPLLTPNSSLATPNSPLPTPHFQLPTPHSPLPTPHSPIDWVIAEFSSYQIESSNTVAPRIGVWTTFTPDHLARHKTLENYYNIKAKLLRQSQLQVFNGDDAYLSKVGASQWSDAYWTSVKGKDYLIGEKGFYIEDGWVVELNNSAPERIVEVSALRMVGEHNQQNLLMSVAAARLAGIEKDAISGAIREFPGVPHRLEHICTWENIDFINDSKATNYDAAEVGLASVQSPVILIAGGEAKAGDDTAWLAKIKVKAAVVLLIGSAAESFAKRLEQVGYTNYEIVETMENAVKRSPSLALTYQASVVLLSPACASFDQYPNFEARGDDFRALCFKWVGSGEWGVGSGE
ncbi:UDP-N-acetylmuramoyl-L-alanine--D-glutamate ligase [Hassallia byssoidea VB512170]|uniref:UDP-N-acetylmuramoylalanine--D-glutamate ligase n=1 Tax=Hassallia byssoidea VB512170 TaxID=1304833 RepID=A0A846HBT7_9CYAN|nr:UDP-N-acetylmuramoyl-L-alanine--D-glutamate ligase [Hassalia byssoidea]NEU74513.1 UDP-N-acetylmuramoyl-L-alanine--D-glutamate ligase [Hassalia byssoidea VB512170]